MTREQDDPQLFTLVESVGLPPPFHPRAKNFGDEDQISAIFHVSQNVRRLLVEEARTTQGAADGARRIRQGLTALRMDDLGDDS